jgi:pimeloyl-ACP methyl ester carboxylesterase
MNTQNVATLVFALSALTASGCAAKTSDDESLPADIPLTVAESGTGPNVLLLHGGSGPKTMGALVGHLSATSHVLLPTYPGWDGAPRPDALDTVAELADLYTKYLAEKDLEDVLVVGNSMGGWLGAELAVRDTDHRLRALVLIDALGVDIEGQPITNITNMPFPQVAQLSFHDPAKLLASLPPSTPESIAQAAANAKSTALFAGDPYGYDPALLPQLKDIQIPTLVIWGDSDKIVTPAYGRAYAAAIPQATFSVITDAGHLPWLEQPAKTFEVLDQLVAG